MSASHVKLSNLGSSLMISIGGTTNQQDKFRLHLAVIQQQSRVVTSLLRDRFPVDTRDNMNRTALHYATRIGNKDITRLLLEHGADVNAGDNRGKRALHFAAKRNEIKMVSILVKSDKVQVDIRDDVGRNAAKYAIDQAHFHLAHLLIKAGCQVPEAKPMKPSRDNRDFMKHLSQVSERNELYALEKESREKMERGSRSEMKMARRESVVLAQAERSLNEMVLADAYLLHKLEEERDGQQARIRLLEMNSFQLTTCIQLALRDRGLSLNAMGQLPIEAALGHGNNASSAIDDLQEFPPLSS